MSLALPLGVQEAENDGLEMTIQILPEYVEVAATKPFLKEIIAYAFDQNFTRFVGGIKGDDKKGIKIFFFSKPDYFDKDDMLVSDYEIEQKVQSVITDEFEF